MKYLFVGDVHNHMYIFDDIKRLDDKYSFDKIIFFGDYVDDWKTTNHESLMTIDTVTRLKKENKEKYVLLLGNHELSYVGYPCSGHQVAMDIIIESVLKSDIDLFDLYTAVDCGDKHYICTHAGITNDYIDAVLSQFPRDINALETMNKSKLKYLDLLRFCSAGRGGSDTYSSFMWADRREHLLLNELQKPIFPYQVIGHSPVQTINPDADFIFVDTHSTYKDGTEFGDKSYLVWLDDKFKIEY